MRASLPVALAVAAIGGGAHAQDYQAFAAELRSLKADADVVAYLEGDLQRARQLQTLEAAMEGRLHLAEEYRAQAQDLRRLQAMAQYLQVPTGGRGSKDGSPAATEDPEAQELELRAAQQVEIARDTLVALVAGYREVKALAVAKKAGAKPRRR
ncbi:MAG TPA: hypothetical protein VLD85_15470 [Anaeromyxobacteraceae bacterium]|nr:hypothetical protein [Anaeromyxobacteraceae bacterium]